MGKVTIYVSEHCEPCKEVKELLEKGQFLVDGEESEIDLVDIETEEGFPHIQAHDLSGIPKAFSEGRQCNIRVDDATQTLLIECGDGESDSSSQDIPSP